MINKALENHANRKMELLLEQPEGWEQEVAELDSRYSNDAMNILQETYKR